MKDLEQIRKVFSKLIDRNNMSLAIWACDRTMVCVSDLINEIVSTNNFMIDAEAFIGIGDKQFVLHYQPIVRLSDRKTVGFEGLIRWVHPDEGFLYPSQFLDKLSNNTLLLLTLEVARIACEQLANLPKEQWIAINISPYDIQNRGFLNRFNLVVDSYKIDKTRLRLEITESAVLEEPWMIQVLRSLSKDHILELDDFGTGYSTLASILSYPISILKIDKSMIDGLPGNRGKERVFRLIIGMAETMGYEVIAEGVETQEQCDWLLYNGCPFGQGYFLGKAQPL